MIWDSTNYADRRDTATDSLPVYWRGLACLSRWGKCAHRGLELGGSFIGDWL
jgi:hypothetical protein